MYQFTLYNKTNDDRVIGFELKSHDNGSINPIQGTLPVKLEKGEVQQGVVEVVIPRDELNSYKEKRSEEHTSELQSRGHLVCRLLLEKKNHHNKLILYQPH